MIRTRYCSAAISSSAAALGQIDRDDTEAREDRRISRRKMGVSTMLALSNVITYLMRSSNLKSLTYRRSAYVA